MANKLYALPDNTVETLHEIMEQKGFKTEVSAIIFLINNYSDNTNLAAEIVKEMEVKYNKLFTRLRLAGAASQKYTYVILDILNSMLFDSDTTELIKAHGATRHTIVKKSEDDYQAMVEKNKQVKDNDNLKKGE